MNTEGHDLYAIDTREVKVPSDFYMSRSHCRCGWMSGHCKTVGYATMAHRRHVHSVLNQNKETQL